MEYFLISAKFVPLKYYTLSSQLRRLTSFSVGCSGRRILSPGQIAVMRKWSRPFSHCIDQAGLGAFTAKSGRKHYNPPPLTVMWMNFDSPNFPSFCSLSAIILFQTCSNKCILYVLSFHKYIKIKYVRSISWLVQSSSRWNTIHSHPNCGV